MAEPLRMFVDALRRMDLEADVCLCGSYARGDWLKDSDVDLIIVSKVFDRMDVGARFSLVKKLMG